MATSSRLQRYRLTGVYETGAEIGRGCYATVVELQLKGLKCAGKKLYPHLYRAVGMLQRFEEECDLLARARHPNIVQFLGVSFEGGTEIPTIVMEFMYTTLATCIDRYGVLPQEVSYSILDDVATALCYLHGNNPQIIHRDLSANNILLSRDMRAKISDLGVAKVLDYTPFKKTQLTTCPGTPSYMPPEALEHNPTYTTSIDTFSFGITMIHLLSGKWPIPSGATVVDTRDPNRIIPRTEAERRQEFIDDIRRDHPLMELILECLSNSPRQRPSAENILRRVRTAAREHGPVHEDKVAQIRADREQRELQQQEIEEIQQQLEHREITHCFRVQQSQREINQLHSEKERLNELLESRNRELKHAASTIQTKSEEIQASLVTIDAKTRENQDLTATIHERDQEIALKQKIIETKQTEIDQLQEENRQAMQYLNTGSLIHPFRVDAQVQWTQGEDLPVAMGVPQSILIGNNLYVGGGGFEGDKRYGSNVFIFDAKEKNWKILPATQQTRFGLTSKQGKLIVVGGSLCISKQVTGRVLAYEKTENRWVTFTPALPTPRKFVCAVSNEVCMVACGGCDVNEKIVDTVEVLIFETDQWQSSTAMPVPRAGLRSTVIGNKVYFMGGLYPDIWSLKNDCFCISLASIQPHRISLEWTVMCPLPSHGSCPISMGGALLAVGGTKDSHVIQAYEPNSREWTLICGLPALQYSSAAGVLTNGQLVVTAGRNGRQRIATTFIGTIKIAY